MNIPSPEEVGLPAKFSRWRHKQVDAINVMITSPKRVKTICAPTGSGKSSSVVAGALLSGLPTCVVTYSRGLQDQYMKDFEEIGMVDLRGRRNYQCDMREDYTCEDGYASRCPYKGTVACESSRSEMRAAISPLVVTNYEKWVAAKKYGQGMSHFKQVIFDEAHHMPEAIAKAMQVTLHHREIEQKLEMAFLQNPEAEDFANWKSWAMAARHKAEVEMTAALAKITGVADPKPSHVKHYLHMRNLCRRLATVSTARAKDWVVEEVEQGFQFDPIRPGRYAESTLLLKVPSIICVSATVRPKTMYMSGIGKDNFEFREFDSDFDPKRCPIHFIPVMRVDWRNPDLRVLWVKLDQILSKRRDRNGIVQTVSYARANEILETSRYWETMIVNPKGEAPTEMVEQFKKSTPPCTLVSPSISTGYDFPDDECRYNFLCKVPFEPPSKILKAREDDDPEYRLYKAVQYMEQSFGRDMRSNTDWSEGFICDTHCEWVVPSAARLGMVTKSFQRRFKIAMTVPPPLRLS